MSISKDGSTAEVYFTEETDIQQQVLGRINPLLSFDVTRTTQKTTPLITFCCGENIFTKPFSSNNRGAIHRHADWWEGLTKYAFEVGSVAVIL
jgi:hypothetical protein